MCIRDSRYRASTRLQALADISRSALCCHSNETRAAIENPSNSAQLEGTPTIPPSYIRVCAVVWKCGKGQTHRQWRNKDTHRRPWPLYILLRLCLTEYAFSNRVIDNWNLLPASCINCSTNNTFKKHLSSELESEAVKFVSCDSRHYIYGESLCLLMPVSYVKACWRRWIRWKK